MARLLVDMAVSTQQALDRMDPPVAGRRAMKRCTGRRWAIANSYAVFTHDLDFGTMLALSGADVSGPRNRPPLSPQEGWLSDGRQVLHFRPRRDDRWSQSLEVTFGEVMAGGEPPLI